MHKWLRINQCYQSHRALEIYIPQQVNTLNKTFKLSYISKIFYYSWQTIPNCRITTQFPAQCKRFADGQAHLEKVTCTVWLIVVAQVWLKLTWCCISCDATVCWKASESAARDFRIEWSIQSLNSGKLCSLLTLKFYSSRLSKPILCAAQSLT